MNLTTHMTVKLLRDHMIGHTHVPKGTKVTIGFDSGVELLMLGTASREVFDPTALPPLPAIRPIFRSDDDPSLFVL